MILIGQYDSPFVRRVAVALNLYALPYEHLPWSTFADADRLAMYNPLRRVPTLVLDDGETLIESSAILDHLDALAGPDRQLFPHGGAERRRALKIAALALGLCDKMVILVYERVLHDETSDAWITRCSTQIAGTLDALEADRRMAGQDYWFGAHPGHADIAVACALRFLKEAHPGIHAAGAWPALAIHSERCEGLEAFGKVVQTFDPPGKRKKN